MNEFNDFASSFDGTWLVIWGGVLLLIKSLFEVVTSSITKEITFKQEQRHKLENVKTEILIEEEKYKLQLRKNLLGAPDEKSLARDVSRIIEILDKICHDLHAYRVSIAIYHNGVHKNFGNYSIRYDETRPGVPKIMNDYQSKPLSPFVKEIQRFEHEDIILYRQGEEMTSSNTDVLIYMRQAGIIYKYVVPILISPDSDVIIDTRQWKIEKKGEDYYILGVLMMDLDKEILYDENEIKITLQNRVFEIISIYKNNPKVFI